MCSARAQVEGTDVPEKSGIEKKSPLRPTGLLPGIPEGGLTIGDIIPEALWQLPFEVYNHPEGKDSIRLGDYRGKLIIIDFLTTGCVPCLAALPKLNALQQQFGKELFLLLSFNEPHAETVLKFWPRNPMTKSLALSAVLSGNQLPRYFPHQAISHLVWIDPAGTLCSTSSTSYATAGNVQQILSGKAPDWKPKIDFLNYDYSQPLLGMKSPATENSHPRNRVPLYSALGGYLEGVASKVSYISDSSSGTARWSVINMPLYQFILYSQKKSFSTFFFSHVRWEVHDRSSYLFGAETTHKEAWFNQHMYCYEAVIPAALDSEARLLLLQNDLKRFFPGLDFRLTDRQTSCLKLVCSNDDEKFASRTNEQLLLLDKNDSVKTLLNQPMSTLSNVLNEHFVHMPVINETGYEGMIDIRLPVADLSDIPAVRKALQAYGLDLLSDERTLSILTISDQPHTFSAY